MEAHAVNCTSDTVGLQDENKHSFTFDRVLGPQSSQEETFRETAADLVSAAVEGYNGTMFAYGQTGSGKTFTMDGDSMEDPGVMRRAFFSVFDLIDKSESISLETEFMVTAQYVQIYNEEVYDLLSETATDPQRKPLHIREHREHGFYVEGATRRAVKNPAACLSALQDGTKARVTGETRMNVASSRSHAVFTLTIEHSDVFVQGDEPQYTVGVLNFVDLAGSENLGRSHADGIRRIETGFINKSLSSLNNVIRALVAISRGDKHAFVPYRDSALTKILRESLGGNARTVMMANISPGEKDLEETRRTLFHANAAKEIKNQVKRNDNVKDTQIAAYVNEISRLRALLAAAHVNDDAQITESAKRQRRVEEIAGFLLVPQSARKAARKWKSSSVGFAAKKKAVANLERVRLDIATKDRMIDDLQSVVKKLSAANSSLTDKVGRLEQQLRGPTNAPSTVVSPLSPSGLRISSRGAEQKITELQDRLDKSETARKEMAEAQQKELEVMAEFLEATEEEREQATEESHNLRVAIDSFISGPTPLEEAERRTAVQGVVKSAFAQVWEKCDLQIQNVQENLARGEPWNKPAATWQYSSPHQKRLIRQPHPVRSSTSVLALEPPERASPYGDLTSSPTGCHDRSPARFKDRYRSVGSPVSCLGAMRLPTSRPFETEF
eukprot:TRINITY_DN3180_c0_g1_i5.p1 TRINITY_DN3180_c0_g1~~TRINITY_DN3180_c0_g1_i5.p1  ORF type:complete len:670 (-),score=167.01 TRINITY_DN3180_c0_g1_i5:279-2288(-)